MWRKTLCCFFLAVKCITTSSAEYLAAYASQESELLAALANASVSEVFVTKDISFTQAEWDRYPRPLLLNRSVSVIGVSLDITLDMAWLKSRITIAPSPDPPAPRIWFSVRNLTVTHVRSPAARTMAGIDLVAVSPKSFQYYGDVLLIADACVPFSLVLNSGPGLERPESLPNEYGNLTQYVSLWPGAWCIPGSQSQCWSPAGRLQDFALVALTYGSTGTPISSGVAQYRNCTYVCRSVIPDNCFSRAFNRSCFQATLNKLGLQDVDSFDLMQAVLPQSPSASPGPSGLQSTPGSENPGRSGAPLAIILPVTIAGGFALIAAATAVAVLVRRRRNMSNTPPVVGDCAPINSCKSPMSPLPQLRDGSSASDKIPAPPSGGSQQKLQAVLKSQQGPDDPDPQPPFSGNAGGEGSDDPGQDVGPDRGYTTTYAAMTNCSSSSSEGQPVTVPPALVSAEAVAVRLGPHAQPPEGPQPQHRGVLPAAARFPSRVGSSAFGRTSGLTQGVPSGVHFPVSLGSEVTSHCSTGVGGCAVAASQTIEAVITSTTPIDQSINMNLVLGRDVLLIDGAVRGIGAFGKVVEGILCTEPDRANEVGGGRSRGRRVAVKMLRGLATSASDKEVESMRKEVEVLSRCRHNNIVRLLGANMTPPEMFLVEELLESSLDKLIHSTEPGTELPLEQVLRITRDVALGLAYLHPTVVHRDLKPSNVLLDEQGTAKLSDFGLARLVAATHHTTSPEVGSVPYMAPECFGTSTHTVSHRSDMYGLGVLIWEMVARVRPWSGEHYMKVALAVSMRGERLPMAAIAGRAPKKLCALVEECWHEDPYRRPSALDAAKRLTVILHSIDTERQSMSPPVGPLAHNSPHLGSPPPLPPLRASALSDSDTAAPVAMQLRGASERSLPPARQGVPMATPGSSPATQGSIASNLLNPTGSASSGHALLGSSVVPEAPAEPGVPCPTRAPAEVGPPEGSLEGMACDSADVSRTSFNGSGLQMIKSAALRRPADTWARPSAGSNEPGR